MSWYTDGSFSMYLQPELKLLAARSLIIASMIIFDKELNRSVKAGELIRVKREEQTMASSLIRMMNKCKDWERNQWKNIVMSFWKKSKAAEIV